MKCPDCNTEMEWGKVYLEGTPGGAILYGRSYKHCYFDSFTGDLKKIKIIDNEEKKRAYYCKACGMVIMK